MVLTDPIADMLTRIRNANSVKHESVDIPASRIKSELARILKEEGYIRDYKVIEDGSKRRCGFISSMARTRNRLLPASKGLASPVYVFMPIKIKYRAFWAV